MIHKFFLTLIYKYYLKYIIINSLINYLLKAFYITIYLYSSLLYYYIHYTVIHRCNYNKKNFINYYFFIYKILYNKNETILYILTKYFSIIKNYANKFNQIGEILKKILIYLLINFNKIVLINFIKIWLAITDYLKLNLMFWTWKKNKKILKKYNLIPYKNLLILLTLLFSFLIIVVLSDFTFFLLCRYLFFFVNQCFLVIISGVSYCVYWVQSVDIIAINYILYFTEVFKTSIEDRSNLLKILSLLESWDFLWLYWPYVDALTRYFLNSTFLYLNYCLWLKQNAGDLASFTDPALLSITLEQSANLLAFLNELGGYESLTANYYRDFFGDFTLSQTVGGVSLLFLQNLSWLVVYEPYPNFGVMCSFAQFFNQIELFFFLPCVFFSAVVVKGSLVVGLPETLNYSVCVLFDLYNFLWILFRFEVLRAVDLYWCYLLGVDWLSYKSSLFFLICWLQIHKFLNFLWAFFILDCVPYFSVWQAYGLISILPNFGILWGFVAFIKLVLLGAGWLLVSTFSMTVCLFGLELWGTLILQIFVVGFNFFLEVLNIFSSLVPFCSSVKVLNSFVAVFVSLMSTLFSGTFLILPPIILWYYLSGFVVFGVVTLAVRYFFFGRTRYLAIRYFSLAGVGVSSCMVNIGRCSLQDSVQNRGRLSYITINPPAYIFMRASHWDGWRLGALAFVRVIRGIFFEQFGLQYRSVSSNGLSFLPNSYRFWGALHKKVVRAYGEKRGDRGFAYSTPLPLVSKELTSMYLKLFLLTIRSSYAFMRVLNDSQTRNNVTLSTFVGFNFPRLNSFLLCLFPMFSVIASLPLFLLSQATDLFFWGAGFTTPYLQVFSSHLTNISGDSPLGATFNSRLLRELGGSPLKFSSENFSALSVASKYFLFVDRCRPVFLNSDFVVKNYLSFEAGRSAPALDVSIQYLKHTFFNALFAEQYYSYPLESLGVNDMGYFSYLFLFVDSVFSNILTKVDLVLVKLLLLPASTLTWLLSYPYFEIYGSGFFTTNRDTITPFNRYVGAELVARELMLLRFLVSNTFLNATLLEGVNSKLLQTRADWMSNQLLSWNWHYRWFNRWHSYAGRHSIRRLRGGNSREMTYVVNPYRIFEQLPDMLIPGAVFTDDVTFLKNFQRLGLPVSDKVDYTLAQGLEVSPTEALSRKMKYRAPRREIPHGAAGNELLRYIAPEWSYYRMFNAGFALSGEQANGVLLRRYNAFFSDLRGQDKVARLLSGVGTWSVGFVPYDYFFKWFYYRYWTSKQSYYLKFMFYEKFQFFKRRKKRLVYGKMKHLWFWRRLIRSNHKSSLWRFNNYKRERLTRQLAFFFYTLRGGFSDFWGETSLYVNHHFNLAMRALTFNFNSFFHCSDSFFSAYWLFNSFPIFYNLFIFWDWLVRLTLYQVLQIFSFFLRTSIAPYSILPVEVLAKLTSDLFLGFNKDFMIMGLFSKKPIIFFFVLPPSEVGGIATLQQRIPEPPSKYLLDKSLFICVSRVVG